VSAKWASGLGRGRAEASAYHYHGSAALDRTTLGRAEASDLEKRQTTVRAGNAASVRKHAPWPERQATAKPPRPEEANGTQIFQAF